MRCSSPMESRTIGSHVSIIHSTNRPNRSNRRKAMGPSTKVIFSLSLANEMQHSNGKLDYRIECKFSLFDKSTESTKSCGTFLQRRLANEMLHSNSQFYRLTNRTKRSNVWPIFQWSLFDSIGQPSATWNILRPDVYPKKTSQNGNYLCPVRFVGRFVLVINGLNPRKV